MSSLDISEQAGPVHLLVCEKQGSVHHCVSNQSIQDKKNPFGFILHKIQNEGQF